MTEQHPVRKVVVKRRFNHPPEAVFDAWLDPHAAGRFLFATPGGVMKKAEIAPHIGGRFEFAEQRGDALVRHVGEYLEIDRPRRLVFTFAAFVHDTDELTPTKVTVEITPDGDGAMLKLVHEGVWADYQERTIRGWTMILDGLARTLER
jgi:uncharacterized protein YndB with AHSA1/START domain